MTNENKMSLAIVIPCYKVKNHILGVINSINNDVTTIYVIDDCCPDKTGDHVEQHCDDKRVKVLRNKINLGVGGAVMHGYREAIKDNIDIIVKIDGDGQMDPDLVPQLIKPIEIGDADYVKGNRFFSLYNMRSMPKIRLFGNAILGLLTKISSGYWSIFDPTNGFTAIHRTALNHLNLKNVSTGYFFETDMLINLGGVGARVMDMPMVAFYGDEESNLHIHSILKEFFTKHCKYTIRRLILNYIFRDFSIGSLHLIFGSFLFLFGITWGSVHWMNSINTGTVATTGTIMISVLPIILGFQLLLNFLTFDITNEPKVAIQRYSD